MLIKDSERIETLGCTLRFTHEFLIRWIEIFRVLMLNLIMIVKSFRI